MIDNISEHNTEGFASLSDEQLVVLVKSGEEFAFDCLYERYLHKIRSMAYPFQGLGYDIEDLMQEATIGFFSAIDVYDGSSASFSTFCYVCMRRMLISLLRTGHKKSSVPRNCVIYDIDELGNSVSSEDPEQGYIAKESYSVLKKRLDENLSDFEKSVLALYLQGMDYNKISEKLKRSVKSVGNALQRVRIKLR